MVYATRPSSLTIVETKISLSSLRKGTTIIKRPVYVPFDRVQRLRMFLLGLRY